MLRLLLQLGLIGGASGLALTGINDGTRQQIESAIRQFSSMAKQSGLPGGEQAAASADRAADAVKPSVVPVGSASEQQPQVEKKAFHNRLPQNCAGEKVVSLDGVVSCSIPDR